MRCIELDPAHPFGPYLETGRAGHHAWWAAASAALAVDNPDAPVVPTGLADTIEEHLAVSIAHDIYAAIPGAECESVNDSIGSACGPGWQMISRDPSAAARQSIFATDLIRELSGRGLLDPELAASLRITAPHLDGQVQVDIEGGVTHHLVPGSGKQVEEAALRVRLRRCNTRGRRDDVDQSGSVAAIG